MTLDRGRLARVLACVAIGLSGNAAAAQGEIWRDAWTLSYAPTMWGDYGYISEPAPLQAPFAATADGGMLVRTLAQTLDDDQIMRLDSAGNVRWRVNLGGFGGSEDWSGEALLGRPDDGAFVAVSEGTGVASIDAFGNVAWLRSVSVTSLAAQNSALLVQNGQALQAFDGASGTLLWQHLAPTSLRLQTAGGVALDETDAIYAGFIGTSQGYPSTTDSIVVKYAPDGTPQWQTHGVPARVLGAAGGLVYATTDPALSTTPTTIALRVSDGSIAWKLDGALGLGLAGTTREVLVQHGGVQRLAAADGAPRWTLPINVALQTLPFVSASGSKAIVYNMQIDVDVGQIDWSATLPTSDGSGASLRLTTASLPGNNQVAFALVPYENTPLLQWVDAATGASGALQALPAAPQGLSGTVLAANPQTVVEIAPYRNGGDSVFALRALDAASGAPQWQTQVSPTPVQTVTPSYTGAVIAGDAVVISATVNTGYYQHPGPGGVWLGAVDVASGNARWSTLFEQLDSSRVQLETGSYDPLADADGNVIVAYGAYYALYPQFPNPYSFVSSVVKLNAVDGSVLWRHDDSFDELGVGDAYPPSVFVLGRDVYVSGSFAAPYRQDTLLKLSGTDGSVLWASNVDVSTFEMHAAVDGNVIVSGGGGWAELDAQTGATLWLNTSTSTCTNICGNGGGEATLADGDAYYASENASRAQLVLLPAQAGASEQVFPLDTVDPLVRQSYAYLLYRAADGTLWTRVSRLYRNQNIHSLVQFDPISHTVLRQQTLYATGASALLAVDAFLPLSAPQNERLLVQAYVRDPLQPATFGTALLDTTVTATGNLSLTFDTDKSVAGIGQPVNFHLHVAYTGDAAISGARLLADFPWVGHASAVACSTQSAGNCVLDTRADTLVASFDMQPGGSVDITGQMRTSDGVDGGKLRAILVGPLGLNELDVSDNAAQAIVNQSLFADGFE